MLGFQEYSWNVLGLLFNSNYLSLKQCTVCIWAQAGEEGTGDMNLLYARWMSPLFEHTTAASCAGPPGQLLWVGAGMKIT